MHQKTDPVTKAVVRVFKAPSGGAVEVQTSTLRLRKQMSASKVVTTVKDGREELVITFDQHSLTVSSPQGRVSASKGRQDAMARAKALIAQSPLAARAAALIGRLGFGADSPVMPMLLTTRAFLLAAVDDGTGQEELRAWVRHAKSRVQVVKASLDQKTPTECWEAYAKEAIAAWIEYEQCMAEVAWWNIFGASACAAIYDLRAIGAFSWWLNCVSLLGIIGG